MGLSVIIMLFFFLSCLRAYGHPRQELVPHRKPVAYKNYIYLIIKICGIFTIISDERSRTPESWEELYGKHMIYFKIRIDT